MQTSSDHLCPRQEEGEGSDDAERMRWRSLRTQIVVSSNSEQQSKMMNSLMPELKMSEACNMLGFVDFRDKSKKLSENRRRV